MSEERAQQIRMLIKFFNFKAGTSFKASNVGNIQCVESAIERAGGDIVVLKNYIREFVETGSKALRDCFDLFKANTKE